MSNENINLKAFEKIKNYSHHYLSLDGIKLIRISNKLKEEIENLDKWYHISFNYCNLKSLINFPNNKNIIRIDLNYNFLDKEEIMKIPNKENITILSIKGNNFNYKEDLQFLSEFKSLKVLFLKNNEIKENIDEYIRTNYKNIMYFNELI